MRGRTVAMVVALGMLAGCAEQPADGAAFVAAEVSNPGEVPSEAPPVELPPTPSASPPTLPPVVTPDATPTPQPDAANGNEAATPAIVPAAGSAWTTFFARYVDEANQTKMTLELREAAEVFDAEGRNVSAYALVEHVWLPGNNQEERVYRLSSEGRIVRVDERTCELSKYRQGCNLKADRVVTFSSAGGVPPHGVLWPQIVEREGDLTSWAYGRATRLAGSAERTEDGVTVRAVVPHGETQHGTANATHRYGLDLPVPLTIANRVLSEFDAGPELAGADPHVRPAFAVHPMGALGPPGWFRGADEAPAPIPMSAKAVLEDAARAAPAISSGRCLVLFAWQSIESEMFWRGVANTSITGTYFGVVGPNATSAYQHTQMTWPNGTSQTETHPAPATLFPPGVCDEIRSFGEADAPTWGGLAFARDRFGLTGSLEKLSYDALGMRATGAPREQGWATVAWTIEGVSMGWNPASERLTYVRAPAAFFE